MIEGATIEGFRGLRHLQVDGFGRVNLVIGKNDCGKTALLEALLISDEPVFAMPLQALRRSRVADKEHEAARDFDRFWRPLFSDMDAERGFSVEVRGPGGSSRRTRFWKSISGRGVADVLSGGGVATLWALDVETTDGGERAARIVGAGDGIRLPERWAMPSSSWIAPLDRVGTAEIGLFSRLKQAGRDAQVLDILRVIEDRVSGVEIRRARPAHPPRSPPRPHPAPLPFPFPFPFPFPLPFPLPHPNRKRQRPDASGSEQRPDAPTNENGPRRNCTPAGPGSPPTSTPTRLRSGISPQVIVFCH